MLGFLLRRLIVWEGEDMPDALFEGFYEGNVCFDIEHNEQATADRPRPGTPPLHHCRRRCHSLSPSFPTAHPICTDGLGGGKVAVVTVSLMLDGREGDREHEDNSYVAEDDGVVEIHVVQVSKYTSLPPPLAKLLQSKAVSAPPSPLSPPARR